MGCHGGEVHQHDNFDADPIPDEQMGHHEEQRWETYGNELIEYQKSNATCNRSLVKGDSYAVFQAGKIPA
jgi:hypothetical protein